MYGFSISLGTPLNVKLCCFSNAFIVFLSFIQNFRRNILIFMKDMEIKRVGLGVAYDLFNFQGLFFSQLLSNCFK